MKADRRAIGETALHRRAKAEIAEALAEHTGVSDVVVERRLDGVRPDVSFCVGDHQVAVEVQCSALPTGEIRRRTEIYAALDRHVLWLCPVTATEISLGLENQLVHPDSWQYYLHDVYGQLYLWVEGQTIVGVDLARKLRASFLWRVPHFGVPNLIADMTPETRAVWMDPPCHGEWVTPPSAWEARAEQEWSDHERECRANGIDPDAAVAAAEAYWQQCQEDHVDPDVLRKAAMNYWRWESRPRRPSPLAVPPAKLWSLPSPPPPKLPRMKARQKEEWQERELARRRRDRLMAMSPARRAMAVREMAEQRVRETAYPPILDRVWCWEVWLEVLGPDIRALLEAAEADIRARQKDAAGTATHMTSVNQDSPRRAEAAIAAVDAMRQPDDKD